MKEKIKKLMSDFCMSNLKEEIDRLLIENNEDWESIETITFEKEENLDKPFYLKSLSVADKQYYFDFYYFNQYSGEFDTFFMINTANHTFLHYGYDGMGLWRVFPKVNSGVLDRDDMYDWLMKNMLLEKVYRPSQHYNGKFIEKLNELLEEENI